MHIIHIPHFSSIFAWIMLEPFSDLYISLHSSNFNLTHLSYTFQRQKIYISLSFISFVIIYPTSQIFISSKLYPFRFGALYLKVGIQENFKSSPSWIRFPRIPFSFLRLLSRNGAFIGLLAKIPLSRDPPPRKHDFIIQISCRLRVHVGKLAES